MDRKVLGLLNVATAAREVVTSRMDRFPSLISDECLSDDTELLAQYTESHWSEFDFSMSETLTMPKGRFGTRPIDVLPGSTRSAYHALLAALKSALPTETRSVEWQEHRRFGSDSATGYLVDMDVASCYEYIDHGVLRGELLLHSCNLALSDGMVTLLGSFMRNGRGLPQMLRPSDLLADTYLSVIDRYLDRRDIPFHRYADDIRMVVGGWGEANEVVEDVADQLRTIGLIASEGKTRILRAENIADPETEDERFLTNKVLSRTSVPEFELTRIMGPYGSVTVMDEDVDAEVSIDKERANVEVAMKIISNEDNLSLDGTMKWLTIQSLASLRNKDERVSDDAILDLLHKDQGMAEHICEYLIARAKRETESREVQWATLRKIVKTGRQSPWTKIWITAAVRAIPAVDTLDRGEVLDWLTLQLQDRHETVRAQAAWALAAHGVLIAEAFEKVYIGSSVLTRHGLAATASKANILNPNVARAVQGDSPLNKAAWAWAQK